MSHTDTRWTISAIKQANRDAGNHWFEPELGRASAVTLAKLLASGEAP